MTDLKAAAQRALSLMDLTTLNDDDTDAKVIALCHQAKSPAGNTAAICIYPRFIPIARKTLREQGTPDVRIATVTNFQKQPGFPEHILPEYLVLQRSQISLTVTMILISH